MSERWRCFVAVPIGERLRDDLAAATSDWKQDADAPDRLRWTDPVGWHVTLAFLGQTDPIEVAAVAATIRSVCGSEPPVTMVPDQVEPWPPGTEHRMLWLRFRDGEVNALQHRIGHGLGVQEHRRFRPHLTLARVAGHRPEDLGAWTERLAAPMTNVQGSEVVLYRTHQAQAGSTYERLATIPLAAVPV